MEKVDAIVEAFMKIHDWNKNGKARGEPFPEFNLSEEVREWLTLERTGDTAMNYVTNEDASEQPYPVATQYQCDCVAWQREKWAAEYLYTPRVPSVLLPPNCSAARDMN